MPGDAGMVLMARFAGQILLALANAWKFVPQVHASADHAFTRDTDDRPSTV